MIARGIASPRHYTAIESLTPDQGVRAAAQATEWAVIVNHGMGQQLHSQTLEQIVRALRDAQAKALNIDPGKERQEVKTQIARLPNADTGDQTLLRAELQVKGTNGATHSVHVYESYWAPLTEGQVALSDCIGFLLGGLARGVWFLIRHLKFDRWLFGGMQKFSNRTLVTGLMLLIGLLLVIVPVLLALVVTLKLGLGALLGVLGLHAGPVSAGAESVAALRALTPDVAYFELYLLALVVALLALPWLANRNRTPRWLRSRVLGIAVVIAWASLVALLVVQVALVYHGVKLSSGSVGVFVPAWVAVFPSAAAAAANNSLATAAIWMFALIAGYLSRRFLIEYVGDVAVYLSAHKLSKFDALRERIRKSVFDVMAAVYRASDKQELLYRNIAVVGHSLGSVISYDILNQLLIQDELAQMAGKPGDAIQARTKLLLTFGSPLDKTAFLFRTKGDTDELREAAAANWQPLIRSYAFRPAHWVNIHSAMDIISGKLHYYDDPTDTKSNADKRVDNVCDWGAFLPLAAHTQYWTTGTLGDVLYRTITG